MNCACGCGSPIEHGSYVHGHNLLVGRQVPIPQAQKLYLYLYQKYGTWPAVSDATKIPVSTIEKNMRYLDGCMSEKNFKKLEKVVKLYLK